jgi:hypothetical protein
MDPELFVRGSPLTSDTAHKRDVTKVLSHLPFYKGSLGFTTRSIDRPFRPVVHARSQEYTGIIGSVTQGCTILTDVSVVPTASICIPGGTKVA